MATESEQEARNQRLREMGEMAARIAHEIRNPLGSIELNTSLLGRGLDEDKKKITDRILASTRSLNAVVSNLLYYTKAPKPSIRKVYLPQLIDELLFFIEFMLNQQKIIVEKKYTGEGVVLGDTELLKQVFLNILRNAVQAMPSGGSLGVKIKQESNACMQGETAYTTVEFSDTGCGIHPENLKKIFYPFFTSKENGTGLGLAIAQNIMDSLQGRINAVNKPGRGSTFTVSLPKAEREHV
ncbi:MAG: PAS domain-containing sensor histidine kinase [Nitrospinota bacterium]